VTADEWERCTDPQKMLKFLRGRASERKLRLFAASSCRRLGHRMDDVCRDAVAVAEQYADRAATAKDLTAANLSASGAYEAFLFGRGPRAGEAGAAYAAARATTPAPGRGKVRAAFANECAVAVVTAVVGSVGTADERPAQCRLLRDLFSPFRPVLLHPAWLAWHGGAIPKLAGAVYDGRELSSGHLDAACLAVLADMLEEGGATDVDLLGHLRGPGPHVRGCFAVDAILGKG
jgi:hypothetical protein